MEGTSRALAGGPPSSPEPRTPTSPLHSPTPKVSAALAKLSAASPTKLPAPAAPDALTASPQPHLVTAIPDFLAGTGFRADPFMLAPITVKCGEKAQGRTLTLTHTHTLTRTRIQGGLSRECLTVAGLAPGSRFGLSTMVFWSRKASLLFSPRSHPNPDSSPNPKPDPNPARGTSRPRSRTRLGSLCPPRTVPRQPQGSP